MTDLIVLMMSGQSSEIWEQHKQMGREAVKEAETCDQVQSNTWTLINARKFILADKLKEHYEFMLDDVRVEHRNYKVAELKRTNHIPMSPEVSYRSQVVIALIAQALCEVKWHTVAQEIINKLIENKEVEEITKDRFYVYPTRDKSGCYTIHDTITNRAAAWEPDPTIIKNSGQLQDTIDRLEVDEVLSDFFKPA